MAARLDQGPTDAGRPAARVPTGPVVVTPMRRRHLRAVLRIEEQVYPRPWSLGLFVSELALADSRLYLVGRISGRVVGYGGLMLAGDDGHVTNVAVDPPWQRQGLATRVLLQLAQLGVARGVRRLTLEVRPSNRGAQDLYRKFGFAPVGIHSGYYVDNGEDALVMWAQDVGTDAYSDRLSHLNAGLRGATLVEGFGDE